MARIKENLVVQQKKITAVEKRKTEKSQKKYAKLVQAEAEAEKAQRKQKRLREIDDWRKESSKRGRTMDKDDNMTRTVNSPLSGREVLSWKRL